ncbi:Sodium/nucleoside cotransporter 2 [Orchesella cincta]|uniref:Sodium/nucleoside cotransporter 2 n=1 Tax=Orchesella cincta TaxID=48709 RepID=A0A1D2M6E2_ORCCI|nr:Sodium/nucleoside cotransporter 2 [Orchesella cincta]
MSKNPMASRRRISNGTETWGLSWTKRTDFLHFRTLVMLYKAKPKESFPFARLYNGIRVSIYNLIATNKKLAKKLVLGLLFLLYNAYFITAILYKDRNELPWEWCDGHGLLIILTGLTYTLLLYFHVLKPRFGKQINNAVIKPAVSTASALVKPWYGRLIAIVAVLGAIIAFVVIDAWDQPQRLISACGVVVMVLIGLLFSNNPARVQWRQVFGGMLIQFIFGLLILRWEGGRQFLDCVSNKVATFLGFSNAGSDFVYGSVSSGVIEIMNSTLPELAGEKLYVQAAFAFGSLSVIYFFSFCVGLLYHLGVMVWVVMKVGWLLQITLGTTAAESMNAAANIFLGQTEAPILIRPFINDMTKSELHAVMTGGFATIAGTVLAAYISFGVPASSLITASVMAAPEAALSNFEELLHPGNTSFENIGGRNKSDEYEIYRTE